MERLTTDNPQNNSETALNLAYAKNKWVHIRGMDEPFTDYIKNLCRRNGCNLSEMSDYEVCECVTECAFTNSECPVFLLFMVATQAAELRARLAGYEDAEEQGRLVRLPCKRGDIVYRICGPNNCRFVAERKVLTVTMRDIGEFEIFTTTDDWLGKTVFLTREEAEAALKEANRNG